MSRLNRKLLPLALLLFLLPFLPMKAQAAAPSSDGERKVYGTSSLMAVVERESGSIAVIDSVNHELLGHVGGLGNLTHATIVFSRDGRYAYVIGREGNLSKVDLIYLKIAGSIKVGENSIGVAISRDNKYLMVCSYKPGSVFIIDAATLNVLKEIPAEREYQDGRIVRSRTVGPTDTPDNLMLFGLMDADGVWAVDMKKEGFPVVKKFWDVGNSPYDQMTTPDGRYYLACFLKSAWMGLLDTWKLDNMRKVSVIDNNWKGDTNVPVYHIPHFKSWGVAPGPDGDYVFIPALAERRIIVYTTKDWSIVKSIPIAGTGLFVVVRPGGREVWVDNVGPPGSVEERLMQVIDVETLTIKKTIDAGKGAIDPQFTPRGEAVYVSVRDEDKVAVYDADTFKVIKEIPVKRPSGIFGSDRAGKFGL